MLTWVPRREDHVTSKGERKRSRVAPEDLHRVQNQQGLHSRCELDCSQNAKRSLPNTFPNPSSRACAKRATGRGRGRCRPARGAPRETETKHPLSPRACGPMTTMVESLPPPPCCASGQSFAPCALDNAQCREPAVSLTYAHPEWNARGARVETHPQTKQSINYAAESGLLMEACRARSVPWEPERANSNSDTPTFSTGRRSVPAVCHPFHWAPERASSVSLFGPAP